MVKATCTWKPKSGAGGGTGSGSGSGSGGDFLPDLIGTGTAIALAQPLGYWNTTAWGTNVLVLGTATDVKAFKEQGTPADSTWSASDNLSLAAASTDAKVTGLEASSAAWDANVHSISLDDPNPSDDEPFTVVSVASITAEPEVVCVCNSNIAYTITTQPAGFEYMVEWTPADVSTPGGKGVIATCGTSVATYMVTVLKVDLDIDVDDDGDVDDDDEAKEESPGAIVFENWDNDDGDAAHTPDKDKNSVAGENDIVPFYPKLEPTLTTGTLKLEATAGGSRVKAWTSATKGTEVTLPKIWDLATETVPTTLYLEGYDESASANDVELKLGYANGGSSICDDKLKITVVRQNLGVAVYRDLDMPWPWAPLGHAGLITGYTGKRTKTSLSNEANWATTEMGTAGIHASDLHTFIATRPPFRGSYSAANLPDTKRNEILRNAADCLTARVGYLWVDAISWNGPTWDGTIPDIHELRCDGLVEVSYELAGLEVWGRNGTHYPIQTWPDEHQNLGMGNPQVELSPVVQ